MVDLIMVGVGLLRHRLAWLTHCMVDKGEVFMVILLGL
jgi:hypothetical protein